MEPAASLAEPKVAVFNAEWDTEGVSVYQAYNDDIADWALEHQRLGGPSFNTSRMTWIKPSFGWVLYRSGYGHKHSQNRILKLKVPHIDLACLLSQCKFVDTNKDTLQNKDLFHDDAATSPANASQIGRVQWDPERDFLQPEGKEPRAMRQTRAIQIGLCGRLSEHFVSCTVKIEDVTPLAHKVGAAHQLKKAKDMKAALDALQLPIERPYMPQCPEPVLASLGMKPGPTAAIISRLGKGKTS